MTTPSASEASAAQRTAFVDDATDSALETPDRPRTAAGIERAWSMAHREGRADVSDQTLTLWNFDIASAALKPAHDAALIRFLSVDTIGGAAHATANRFRITGRASLTGGEQGNITVSGRRAEAVASLFSSRFGIRQTRIVTNAAGDMAQIEGGAEGGEQYAYNRQVAIERIAPPIPRDEELAAPQPPKPPVTPEKSHGPPVVAEKVEFEFRVPESGVLMDPGKWVTFYIAGTFKGEARNVEPGSPDSIGVVGMVMAPLSAWKVKINAEGKTRLTEGMTLKFGVDFDKPSPTPGAPFKAIMVFDDLGGIDDVELGMNFKDLRAPFVTAKSWRVPAYRLVIDGQPIDISGEVKATLGFGPGPTLRQRAGAWVSRLVSRLAAGAVATETGAVVGTVGAGTVIGGIIAVPILMCAVMFASAQTMKFANDEGDRRARLIARRLGFSLAIAAEALRPVSGPEVKRYVTGVDLEYARLAPVRDAYNWGQTEAMQQMKNNAAVQTAFRAAVRAAFGSEIEKAHQAIFQKLGGLDKGDESAALHLADAGV